MTLDEIGWSYMILKDLRGPGMVTTDFNSLIDGIKALQSFLFVLQQKTTPKGGGVGGGVDGIKIISYIFVNGLLIQII